MTNFAEAGYGQVRQQTADPRSVEQQLLLQIATDLETADQKSVEGYKAFATNVKRNMDLWMAFATDVSNPDNPLPQELKEGIVKITAFVISQTPQVLKGDADVTPLITVNRNIAAGLRNAQKAAA